MKEIKCCLCNKKILEKESHNASPLVEYGRCCSTCNETKVIPERISRYIVKNNKEVK